jgi:hypothetical protein
VTPGGGTPTECAVPDGSPAGLSARPTGLVAFAIYTNGKDPFSEQVFADPSVSGVDLLLQWDNVEPAPNMFDWSVLDCVFAGAHTHHKFVALSLVPGFRSPSWVLQIPGVQTQSFKFSYDNKQPARPLPLPWNDAYLNTWFTFMGAVAQRYGNTPEFRLIQVAGPTSVSTEMSLPDREGDAALPAAAHGSDIAEWISLGYTPNRYVDAWKKSFDKFHELFPNQYLGLALYPGLPIGNNGAEDQREKVATRMSVIAVGMRYKQQFDLQEDGMKGGTKQPNDPGYNAVRDHCGDIVTGLQNAKSETVSPADQGPNSRSLEHVVAAGVDFWEVYVPDIENPSMKDVLKPASTELPAHQHCKH